MLAKARSIDEELRDYFKEFQGRDIKGKGLVSLLEDSRARRQLRSTEMGRTLKAILSQLIQISDPPNPEILAIYDKICVMQVGFSKF